MIAKYELWIELKHQRNWRRVMLRWKVVPPIKWRSCCSLSLAKSAHCAHSGVHVVCWCVCVCVCSEIDQQYIKAAYTEYKCQQMFNCSLNGTGIGLAFATAARRFCSNISVAWKIKENIYAPESISKLHLVWRAMRCVTKCHVSHLQKALNSHQLNSRSARAAQLNACNSWADAKWGGKLLSASMPVEINWKCEHC